MKPDNSTPEMYERCEEEEEEEGVKIKWKASRPGREQGTEGDRGRKTGLSEVQAAENVACRVSPREPEEERMVGDTRRKTGGTGSPPPPFSPRIYKD